MNLVVYFEQIMVKNIQFELIFVFFFHNGTLMGGWLCKKLEYIKSNFPGPADTSTYNFGESTLSRYCTPPSVVFVFLDQANDLLLPVTNIGLVAYLFRYFKMGTAKSSFILWCSVTCPLHGKPKVEPAPAYVADAPTQ